MIYHKTCPCCWTVVSAYTINLSEQMIDAFKIFVKKYLENRCEWYEGLKKWEIWLKNAQYSNFQNLRYFWIIMNNWGKRLLTRKWYDFYSNIHPILNPAWFMAGKTLPDDHEARITHKPRKEVYMSDVEKIYQDKHEKYVQERTKPVTVY